MKGHVILAPSRGTHLEVDRNMKRLIDSYHANVDPISPKEFVS